jgi:superfamily II DNA/RNA helicase
MPDTILRSALDKKLESLTTTISGTLPYRQGNILYLNGQCKKLSEAEKHFEFSVDDKHGDFFVQIDFNDGLVASCSCKSAQLCRHQIASCLQLRDMLKVNQPTIPGSGIKYSREGMIKRVIDERRLKAKAAKYSLEFADNIYGEHLLTNEKGREYHITFRDLKRKHGYCSCPDYRTNKLGTCKHLIFAFDKIADKKVFSDQQLPDYPFIEIFLNPFREYKISWFHPEKPSGEVAELLYRYFGNKNFIEDEQAESFAGFINNASKYKQILIRPEVPEKIGQISQAFALARKKQVAEISLTDLRTDLLPFQKEGIKFATFNTGAIIADEMGLGKNIQAIGTALLKKQLFGFGRTLIVCPASMIEQWVSEIGKLTNETVLNLDFHFDEEETPNTPEGPFFNLTSYENLIRNFKDIRFYPPDFLILDEAQRIANYESLTFSVLKSIPRKHVLALTGTPNQSKLIDLYSLMLLVDPGLLTPLWEFSYQHCYFDKEHPNQISGFYDLDKLNKKLEKVLIQRQKHEVIDELPSISQFNIPVKMHPEQQKLHRYFLLKALDQLNKKLISNYDLQQLTGFIRSMRMVSSSSYLIDNTTNYSPKLEELNHILTGKLDIGVSNRKVLVLTEWKRMLNIIAKLLESNQIHFVEIGEDTSAKNKQLFLKQFREDDHCKILLTTEDTAKELDLKIADTLINVDTPISKRQKNHRLEIVDPIRHGSAKLTIINLIADNSIETWSQQGADFQKGWLDPIVSPKESETTFEISAENLEAIKNAFNALLDKQEQNQKDKAFAGRAKKKSAQTELDFSDEDTDALLFQEEENFVSGQIVANDIREPLHAKETVDQKELKKALKSGVEFLSQLVKMSTGKSIDLKGKKIDMDIESGEITLKFKITDKGK